MSTVDAISFTMLQCALILPVSFAILHLELLLVLAQAMYVSASKRKQAQASASKRKQAQASASGRAHYQSNNNAPRIPAWKIDAPFNLTTLKLPPASPCFTCFALLDSSHRSEHA
jgi:hypothetical protein